MTLVEEVTKRFRLRDLGEHEFPDQFLLRLKDHQAMGWELVELGWEQGEPSVVMRRERRFLYPMDRDGETPRLEQQSNG